MVLLERGQYRARLAADAADLTACQRLRYLAFRGSDAGLDADSFDDACQHVLIEDTADSRLVCCFRLLPLADGSRIHESYAAQYYELSGLGAYRGQMMEMGRFCIRPGRRDADILRVAWGAMSHYVDQAGVELLFGCSSFKGTEAEAYRDAFALLTEKHLAPKRWLPKVKAPAVVRFAQKLRRQRPDMKRALLGMPPLLRSYLMMGGWVSDHAVVDRDLGTLHVFTGLEIRAIPPARVRLMRAAVP